MDAAVWLMAHGCRSGRENVHSSQLMETLNGHNIYSPFRGWRTFHGSSEVIVGFCGGGERQMMRDDEDSEMAECKWQHTAIMTTRITKWELYLLEPVWFKLCASKRISFFWWKWKHSEKLCDSRGMLFSLDVVFAVCFNRRSSRCNHGDCTLSRISTRDISGAGQRRITKKIDIWSCLFQHVRAAVRINQT